MDSMRTSRQAVAAGSPGTAQSAYPQVADRALLVRCSPVCSSSNMISSRDVERPIAFAVPGERRHACLVSDLLC